MTLILSGTDGLSDVDGSAATPAIRGTDTNTGIFFPAADTVAVATGGTERVRVDSSGNVGIGTSSPSGASGVTLAINGGAGQTRLALKNTASGDTSSDGFQIALLSDGVNVIYQNRESGYQAWENGGTERMRIDSSGNLLVGTTSSTYKVDITTSGNNGLRLQDGTNQIYLGWTGGNAATGTLTNVAYTFITNGSERARITNDGNFCFGTTSTTVNPGVSVLPTGRINIGRSNDDAVAEFYRSGTRVGQINVTTTATSYITSSDYRLKENIAPMTGALATVAALNPCTYTWKADGSAGQGFIAHELAEVVPDCVTGEKDAVETYTDEEGNEQTRPKYQGIDTSFLVATLTAAIQEQQAIIQSLTARIEALEGK